ncbi:MAG: hypothetical protein R3249_03915 [Nitriliruptorales bacterium]|nr:hypothetical protein [Nitriliruptorales bacterium]
MTPSIDEVLAEGWFGNVSLLPADELRAKRDVCRQIEASVSYRRRVLQGQLDIVRAEADRRSSEGDDVSGVLDLLPGLLGGGSHESPRANLRSAPVVAPDVELEGESLADLGSVSNEELHAIAERLTERERLLSAQRRALHELIDAAQDEIARRYKSGAAMVTDVIHERL